MFKILLMILLLITFKINIFLVYIWPGPYNFASTEDNLKTSATFPFTPDGKQQAVDWMNEQWTARKDEWRTL